MSEMTEEGFVAEAEAVLDLLVQQLAQTGKQNWKSRYAVAHFLAKAYRNMPHVDHDPSNMSAVLKLRGCIHEAASELRRVDEGNDDLAVSLLAGGMPFELVRSTVAAIWA